MHVLAEDSIFLAKFSFEVNLFFCFRFTNAKPKQIIIMAIFLSLMPFALKRLMKMQTAWKMYLVGCEMELF